MFFSKRHVSFYTAAAVRHGEPISMLNAVEPADERSSSTTRSKQTFRQRILHAAGWSMLGYGLSQLLRIASNLILTRLLVPEMFGVMAIATMIQVAVAMLSDLGLRQAAIRSPMGENQVYLDTTWTLQFIHACFIWLTCVAIAVAFEWGRLAGWFPAGSVYVSPELPWIIASTSFATVLLGLQSTKIISAYRRIELAHLTFVEIATQLVSLAVAVGLALYTRSIWSFVVSTLVSSIVFTILSHVYLKGGRNRFRLNREAISDLVGFGRWIMLSSMFTVLAANGDRILLAGWVSPVTLGIYVLAFNLVAILEGAGNRLFSSVAMPALSNVFNEYPDRLRDTYYKFRLPFDAVFVGSAGAVYAGSKMIIETLYDERYVDATHMVEVFSFGLLVSRYGIASSVFLATGEPRYQTLLNFIKSLSIFSIVPLSYYFFGFEGALWAISLHALPTLPVIFFLNAHHRLNKPMFEALILLAWPLGYAAATIVTEIVHSM
jgi:O-antigen/teichoic acid export membrane protein